MNQLHFYSAGNVTSSGAGGNTTPNINFRHSGGEIKQSPSVRASGGLGGLGLGAALGVAGSASSGAQTSQTDGNVVSSSGVSVISNFISSHSHDGSHFGGGTSGGGGEGAPSSPTPPLQRRLAKSFSVAPSISAHAVISMAHSKGAHFFLTISRIICVFCLICVLLNEECQL